MIVMGLDTTGPYCSVSIVDEARIAAHISVPMARGHAEALAPMVQDAFKIAQLSAQHIDKLAVCTGPGSFTGLRAALSFAKGFALPRKLPVIGLSSLEIWAAQADPEGLKDIISIADVRRDELCWARISKGIITQVPITQAGQIAREQIAKIKADKIIEDSRVDTRILAWLAADLSPQSRPALPLYSRGPDAKLPSKTVKPKTQHRAKPR